MSPVQTKEATLDGNIYALVPRRVVLNRMQTADCLESRVHWAIILCSWCGPKPTKDGAVVVRDRRGFIQKDAAGNPQPAKAQDLLKVLGLAPEMKGNLSRAIARLKMKGVIRFERKIMYAVASPPILEDTGEVVTVTTKSCHRDNFWSIASVIIRADQLPDDPSERRATVEFLNSFQNEHRRKLLVVNTTDRELLRAELSKRGILIDKRSRKEESQSSSSAVPESSYEGSADDEGAPPPSAAVVVPPSAHPPAPAPSPASWETFKEVYPPDHLDGPKAKPLFEALSPENKRICIERLQVYRQSPRWKKSPQYIPLASNWLQSAYDEPPPPFFEPVDPKLEKQKSSILRVAEMARRMRRSPA
jgi:hypothetical protein